MRVDRAKGHTGTASASSAPSTADQLLEQTRAKGRLPIQLSEQTLDIQLLEQTRAKGRLPIQLSEQTLPITGAAASASSRPFSGKAAGDICKTYYNACAAPSSGETFPITGAAASASSRLLKTYTGAVFEADLW
jgi:hypothetical protein